MTKIRSMFLAATCFGAAMLLVGCSTNIPPRLEVRDVSSGRTYQTYKPWGEVEKGIGYSFTDIETGRKITLTNHDSRPHMLELTSFVEVALSPKGADLAHPAFNKLFLETEWVPESGALLCRRRPRSAEQEPIWAVHVIALDRETVGASFEGNPSYETDRGLFLGRGGPQ